MTTLVSQGNGNGPLGPLKRKPIKNIKLVRNPAKTAEAQTQPPLAAQSHEGPSGACSSTNDPCHCCLPASPGHSEGTAESEALLRQTSTSTDGGGSQSLQVSSGKASDSFADWTESEFSDVVRQDSSRRKPIKNLKLNREDAKTADADRLQRERRDFEQEKQEMQWARDTLAREREAFEKEKAALAARMEREFLEQQNFIEKERTQLTRRAAELSCRQAAHWVGDPIWEFEGDDGSWQPCSEAVRNALNEALIEKKTRTMVQTHGQWYEFDLETKRQINVRSSRSRNIAFRCELPEHWCSSDEVLQCALGSRLQVLGEKHENVVRQIFWKSAWRLPGLQPSTLPSEQLYLKDCPGLIPLMQALLRATCYHHMAFAGGHSICAPMKTCKVLWVRQVRNLALLRRYEEFLRELVRKHHGHGRQLMPLMPDVTGELQELEWKFPLTQAAPECVKERFLFHGTRHVADIVKDGFDFRVARDSGLYGRGTYFGSQSCKSNQYCGQMSRKTLLVSRVALGDSFVVTQADPSMSRPPQNLQTGLLYDSLAVQPRDNMLNVAGGAQWHQEFVIFDHRQAYPELVIDYEC